MSQKDIIDMAADRGKYICQSQSLNLFMAAPDPNKLTSMHFYAWKKGLKTGIYYLRRRAVAKAQQFTLDPRKFKEKTVEKVNSFTKTDEPECLSCSA